MFNFSMPELFLVLVIALIVFGPGKLPEVGKALGKGLGEFRRSMNVDSTTINPLVIEAKVAEETEGNKVVAKTSEESKA